jgi:hypothetical protein
MKRRITKTKLLAKLTKMINEAQAAGDRHQKRYWWLKRNPKWYARYNALLEVRDFINTHRI